MEFGLIGLGVILLVFVALEALYLVALVLCVTVRRKEGPRGSSPLLLLAVGFGLNAGGSGLLAATPVRETGARMDNLLPAETRPAPANECEALIDRAMALIAISCKNGTGSSEPEEPTDSRHAPHDRDQAQSQQQDVKTMQEAERPV